MPLFPDLLTAEETSDVLAGDLITDDWQVQLRNVLMEADNQAATYPIISWLEGLGVDGSRYEDRPVTQDHGLYPGKQYLGGRPLKMGVAATGATQSEAEGNMRDLVAAWAPVADADADSVVPLVFRQSNGQAYLVYGRPTKCVPTYSDLLFAPGSPKEWVVAACEFLATDPSLYSADLLQGTTGFGSSSGGLGFPHGFPHGFGTSTPGSVDATNLGNFRSYPIITFTASSAGCTNPQVTVSETGEAFETLITLAAGETLVCDMKAQTVMLNGTASRLGYVNLTTSTFFALAAGANTLQFSASGTGSTMTVEWRHAWLL